MGKSLFGRYYNDYFKDKVSIRPEKISFKEEVLSPISHLSEDQRKTLFPKPYFDIKNGNAIAIYGNYVDDLVKLKNRQIESEMILLEIVVI
jgi:hypothetical protein